MAENKKITRVSFHPDNIPLIEPKRSVVKCPKCKAIMAHDFIPFGLGSGVWFNRCMCWMDYRCFSDWAGKLKTLDTYEK